MLSEVKEYAGKKIILAEIYSGNKHGWNVFNFHEKCDNKGATVTIFKSKKK